MNLVKRVRSHFQNKSSHEFIRATEEDIYYCYRLFLNREPDPAGYADWVKLVKNLHITIEYLTDGFLYSREFLEMQAQRDEPKLIELPDYKIVVRLNDHMIGAAIARSGQYEPHVTAVLRQLLKPDMIFLDIGANIGYFTLLAASIVGENGRVLSFEPVPANIQLLQQSIAANTFHNITLYPRAVLETSQEIALEIGGKNSNSRVVNPDSDELERPLATAVVLDEVLNHLPRLDVVKMDIEGAEPRALQGMTRLVQKHRPTLITEFSPDLIQLTSGVNPLTFLQQLTKLDYDLFNLLPGLKLEHASPQSPTTLMQLCQQTGGTHLDIVARPMRNKS
jgi:FkbM family methyltransferase